MLVFWGGAWQIVMFYPTGVAMPQTLHVLLCHHVRVLFAFFSFHLHRRIRYEPFGPWQHFPCQTPSSTTAPKPREEEGENAGVRLAAVPEHAGAGAVVDEWESDEEAKPLPPMQRLTRTLAQFCSSLGVQPE